MAEILIENAPKAIRDLYTKAFTAFDRGNLDYALDLFLQVVKAEPRLLQARKYIRAAAIQRFKQKKQGFFARAMSGTSSVNPKYLMAQRLLKPEKAAEAVMAVEELLKDSPLDMNYIKLFVKAAALADLPEAAVQSLEIARDAYPEDVNIVNMLGTFYMKMGRTRSARECFERVCEMMPNDPDAVKQLKDALAIDSMDSGGWTQATSYRDIMKDSKEAKVLEQQSKAVKTQQDVDSLIEDQLQKIAKEPGNINYLRALSKLYVQKDNYEAALATMEKAQELSPGDPELDAAVADIHNQHFDYQIKTLLAAGDQAGAEAKDNEKRQFLFDDLQARVQRYPNDLKIKYEWGTALFNNDYFDEAIQQFQAAQRNPKFRTPSLFHLAMCFKAKKQWDLADAQLEKAGSELYQMDESKKEILYERGLLAEEMGKKDKAAEYFKQIYSVDIQYKNVAEKVEKIYGA
jgi:tetratricopeptide (TPR) repeat protein